MWDEAGALIGDHEVARQEGARGEEAAELVIGWRATVPASSSTHA